MKGFYHIWAWRPSWSCDLDFLYTHWFPLPIYVSYKIWLWLAKRFQRRRSLKLWTDGWTTDGRTPDHGHPISSPCEPNGSGELKRFSRNSPCQGTYLPEYAKTMSVILDLSILLIYEPVHEKTNNLGSEKVPHKPGFTLTEDG